MEQYTLAVEGMHCGGCEERVSKAVKRVDDVHRVEPDHESGTVEITAEAGTEDAVRRAVHDAGYDVAA